MTDEDDEFVRIEKESLWRKRQIEEDLGQPVYFKPKKEWVGLTEQEKLDLKNANMPTMALIDTVCSILRMQNHD